MDSPIFLLLSLLFSVLSIILFFKIWGMTNNVRDIKTFLIMSRVTNGECKEGDIVLDKKSSSVLIVVKSSDNEHFVCWDLFSKKQNVYSKSNLLIIKKA